MENGDHGKNGGGSNYESAHDLNKITRRQLEEDIQAYRYDLDFCKQQIYAPDLTSQEARVIQLRILDMGHQIRHCQHRIELIDAQSRGSAGGAKRPMFAYDGAPNKRPSTDPQGGGALKRPRPAKAAGESDGDDATIEVDVALGERSVTRLGFWKCHLCTSHKFLSAGSNRVPSAPCKWPLKDISKSKFMESDGSPGLRKRKKGPGLYNQPLLLITCRLQCSTTFSTCTPSTPPRSDAWSSAMPLSKTVSKARSRLCVTVNRLISRGGRWSFRVLVESNPSPESRRRHPGGRLHRDLEGRRHA